jgi:hypothetical protein
MLVFQPFFFLAIQFLASFPILLSDSFQQAINQSYSLRLRQVKSHATRFELNPTYMTSQTLFPHPRSSQLPSHRTPNRRLWRVSTILVASHAYKWSVGFVSVVLPTWPCNILVHSLNKSCDNQDSWLGRVGIWGWSWGRDVSRFGSFETKRNLCASDDDDNNE